MTESLDEQRLAKAKAMGALFLSHQVKELEKSVETINFSRDSRLYNNNNNNNKHNNISSSSTTTSRNNRGGPGNGGNNDGKRSNPRESRIVDVSVLIHALPLLKRWIREDKYLLIVPLEVISILDELKKAPQPLHDQGKEATRFLETYFDIARQIQSESNIITKPSSNKSNILVEDLRIRLRPQLGKEELNWIELEQKFIVPKGYDMKLPPLPPRIISESIEGEEEEEEVLEPVPTPMDIPKSIRSILQCALYFQSQSSSIKLPSTSTTTTTTSSPPVFTTTTKILSYPTIPTASYTPQYPLHIPRPSLPPLPSKITSSLPPPHPSLPKPPLPIISSSSSSSSNNNNKNLITKEQSLIENFNQLSSGNNLIHFGKNFLNLSVQEINLDQVKEAKEWAKKLASDRERSQGGQGGQGNRGGGGGGGGGGRGGNRGRGRGSNNTGSSSSSSSGSRGGILFVP